MKLESFIAGTILGTTFSNPNNRQLLIGLAQKGASLLVDGLNKRGGMNAPSEKETMERPAEPIE